MESLFIFHRCYSHFSPFTAIIIIVMIIESLFREAFECCKSLLSASLYCHPAKCRCELYTFSGISAHLEYFFMALPPIQLPSFHLPPVSFWKIKEKCELSFNNFDNSTFHHASCRCQKRKHEQRKEEDKKRKKLIFSFTDKIQCFSLWLRSKFYIKKSSPHSPFFLYIYQL